MLSRPPVANRPRAPDPDAVPALARPVPRRRLPCRPGC